MNKKLKKVLIIGLSGVLVFSGIGVKTSNKTKKVGVELNPSVSHAMDLQKRKEQLKKENMEATESEILKKLIKLEVLVPDPEKIANTTKPSYVFNPELKKKAEKLKNIKSTQEVKKEENKISLEMVLEHLGIDIENRKLPPEISEQLHTYVDNTDPQYDYDYIVNRKGEYIKDEIKERCEFIEEAVDRMLNQTPGDDTYNYLKEEKYHKGIVYRVPDKNGGRAYSVSYDDMLSAMEYYRDSNNISRTGVCIMDTTTYAIKRDGFGKLTPALSGVAIYRDENTGKYYKVCIKVQYATNAKTGLEEESRPIIIDGPIFFYEEPELIEGLKPIAEQHSDQIDKMFDGQDEEKGIEEGNITGLED